MNISADLALAYPQLILAVGALLLLVFGAFSPKSTTAIAGADAGNYTLDLTGSPTALADILKKAVTAAGSFTVLNRTYDGTTNAAIDTNSLTVACTIGGDVVNIGAAQAFFTTKNAGTGKTVVLGGTTALAGADAANYTLSIPGSVTALADIAQKANLSKDAARYSSGAHCSGRPCSASR